jgi:hypothetical protein
MGKNGGTEMWCERCEAYRPCAAQRALYNESLRTLVAGIHVRERGRQCLVCDHEWTTFGVDANLVRDLAEARQLFPDAWVAVEATRDAAQRAAEQMLAMERLIDDRMRSVG